MLKQYRLTTSFDSDSVRADMTLTNGGEWCRVKDHEADKAAAVEEAARDLRAEKDAAKREAESIREQSNRQLLAILSLLGDMPAYLSQGDHGWSVAYQGVRERLESSKAVEAMLHDDPAVPSHGPAPLTDAERDARIRRLERRLVGQGTNRDFAAFEADVKAGK